MKFLTTLLAITVFALPTLAQQPPARDPYDQPITDCIDVAPQNLHPGDQAVIFINSRFQQGKTEPIDLKPVAPSPDVDWVMLINSTSWSKQDNPDSLSIKVFRVTLKADSYEFKPSDFINLPEGFNFPKLKIFREKN